MSTSVTLFDNKTAVAVPDYIANREVTNSDVVAYESIHSITFRGSKWRLKKGDEEVLLTKTIDGEKIPVPSISVIVVGANPKRSRTYFEGNFVEGENRSPNCWSTKGDVPDPDVTDKQASTCDSCKWSVKGSRVSENGKDVMACQYSKRLAVVPIGLISTAENPFLLKVPQTSLWDKDNKEAEAQQKFAWDQYIKFLKNRNVQELRTIVTRITFDPNPAYPKLQFQALRWATAEEIAAADALLGNETTQAIIGNKVFEQSPAKIEHDDNTTTTEADEEEVVAQQPPKPVKKPAPAPKTIAAPAKAPAKKAAIVEDIEDDDENEDEEDDSPIAKSAKAILDELDDEIEAEEAAKPAPKKAVKRSAKPAAPAAKEEDVQGFDLDDGEEDDDPPVAPKKAVKKVESKQSLPSTKGDISELAENWD